MVGDISPSPSMHYYSLPPPTPPPSGALQSNAEFPLHNVRLPVSSVF